MSKKGLMKEITVRQYNLDLQRAKQVGQKEAYEDIAKLLKEGMTLEKLKIYIDSSITTLKQILEGK